MATNKHTGLLFEDDHSSDGSAVDIRCDGRTLVIESLSEPFPLRVSLEKLSVERSGYGGRVILHWSDVKKFSLSVEESFLHVLDPKKKFPGVQSARQKIINAERRFDFFVALSLGVSVLVCAGFLILLLYWEGPRAALVNQIPLSVDTQIGQLAFKSQSASRTTDHGPLVERVKRLGEPLCQKTRFTCTFYVTEDPTTNAFAYPGGYVVVTSGLLQTVSDDELAGVLAHEVAHVEHRHSMHAIVYSVSWQMLLSAVFGSLNSGSFRGAVGQLAQLSFSRAQETQADKEGLTLLQQTGFSMQGMATFFDRLARNDTASVPMLSTHPSSAERLKAIREEITARQHS